MNKLIFTGYAVLIGLSACQQKPAKDTPLQEAPIVQKTELHKPPANYQDTLPIDYPTAVIYYPDSLQLQKIKEITDTAVFESLEHEYYYLLRNARTAIKAFDPRLKITEAKNKRYLLFIKADKSSECIDLNTKDDTYGLFVFDRKKSPSLLDLANIDRGLWFYFSQ